MEKEKEIEIDLGKIFHMMKKKSYLHNSCHFNHSGAFRLHYGIFNSAKVFRFLHNVCLQ